ncbi:MAG: glycosyltransferase family 9 protein [Elusimicrobiota bacterium]|jgi:ADP-heptose:LPS heptosyltransferase|nr:glycosyltransferase family 9 protein [Elusimicrobiota bacterium]
MKKKILISALSFHMGDFIWAASALAIIKKTYPEIKITVIIPKSLKDLAIDNPVIDDVIFSLYSSQSFISRLKQISWNLKNIPRIFFSRYDACIILAQSKLTVMLAKICRIPRIVGADLCLSSDKVDVFSKHYTDIIKMFPNQTKLHVSMRFQNIVKSFFGIYNNALPVLPSPDKFAESAKKFIISDEKLNIALCMSGNKNKGNLSLKEWKIEDCAKFIKTLNSKFNARFYFLGVSVDAHKVQEISSLSKECEVHNLCGKTSIGDALCILQKNDLCISVDTGILHLAAASNIPVIALHGPTSPQRTGGMSWKVKSLYHIVDCSCDSDIAKAKKHCLISEKIKCMEAITPDEIMDQAVKILNKLDKK